MKKLNVTPIYENCPKCGGFSLGITPNGSLKCYSSEHCDYYVSKFALDMLKLKSLLLDNVKNYFPVETLIYN